MELLSVTIQNWESPKMNDPWKYQRTPPHRQRRTRTTAVVGGIGVFIGSLALIAGAIALVAWAVMLLLGALHSVTDWPANQGGYLAAVIITVIAAILGGGGRR